VDKRLHPCPVAEIGCHKNLYPATRLIPSQKWCCTIRPLNLLDRDIKHIGKKYLNLPQRASVESLYLSYQRGGLNLLPITIVADISQIAHGLALLHSAHLGHLAMAFLKSVVQKRIRRQPELQDLDSYLNGSMEGAFANEPTDISNVWTSQRSATRRLRSKL